MCLLASVLDFFFPNSRTLACIVSYHCNFSEHFKGGKATGVEEGHPAGVSKEPHFTPVPATDVALRCCINHRFLSFFPSAEAEKKSNAFFAYCTEIMDMNIL